jgi:hypothetical protein
MELFALNYLEILQEDVQRLNRLPTGIISTILSPACTVWLKSQVTKVEELSVNIDTSDRRILSGSIDRLSIVAQDVVYQGLFLGKINLVAKNISINIGQVLKGKPLRLLSPIPVELLVKLRGDDLQRSLSAPLFSQALTDLFNQIFHPTSAYQINWQGIIIDRQKLTLQGEIITDRGDCETLTLVTGVEVIDGHVLSLTSLVVESSLPTIRTNIDEYKIDLGTDVNLSTLSMDSGEIICEGVVLVNP